MDHPIVSREDWLTARRALLAKEKALTRLGDDLAAERRALPWVEVEKSYTFDGSDGPLSLSDLFAGRSQLFVKHFMMGPGQTEQCVGCAFEADHMAGILVHLENHDLAYAAIARAPIAEIEAYKARMGWTFPFVSSFRNDFNYDFNVSYTPQQIAEGRALYNFRNSDPGLEDQSGDSVFYKDEAGRIFHPIPASAGVANSSWAPMPTSTRRHSAARRTAPPPRSQTGCARTTCTVRVARSRAAAAIIRRPAAVARTNRFGRRTVVTI